MTFGEKLDLLISIAAVSNSEVARNVGLDASFVSRLRRGERPPSKNQNYIGPLAAYFASCYTSGIQKLAVSEMLGIRASEYPNDKDACREMIHHWLLESKNSEKRSVEDLLSLIAAPVNNETIPELLSIDIKTVLDGLEGGNAIYYGTEGKQKALIAFLSLVIAQDKPMTLLIYSSEDIEWLMYDRTFLPKWTALTIQAIRKGCRVRIVHSIKRGAEDMLASIREWMPLYMSGAMEPYYNPRVREEIFGRTLMVAPGVAALTSSSIGKGVRTAANFLYTDTGVVEALNDEFNGYLEICKPLMKIFTESNIMGYGDMFIGFDNAGANSIIKTDSLSCITMPLPLAARICSNSNERSDKNQNSNSNFLFYHQSRIKGFEKRLKKWSFIEIIALPDPETLKRGAVTCGFCDVAGSFDHKYTPADYREHLLNIIRLLENSPNYHVCLTKETIMPGNVIYFKEREGVIIEKASRPAAFFGISETSMTQAFEAYMNGILQRSGFGVSHEHRRKTIGKLRNYIKTIENHISEL